MSWSFWNLVAMITPIILFSHGPVCAAFHDRLHSPGRSRRYVRSLYPHLFHIIGVLIVVVPLSTWFYQLTGKSTWAQSSMPACDVDVRILPGGGPIPV